MPPSEEVLGIQAEVLNDEFNREEKRHVDAEGQENSDEATNEAEKEVKLFMFILRHRAFFRVFIEQLSSKNEIRQLWDRVAKGPERALEALEVNPDQYPFRDEAEEYIKNTDPDTYTTFTESLEALEGKYDEFSADLKSFIERTDPEAFTALTNALDEGNTDAADNIIETLGHMHNRTEE